MKYVFLLISFFLFSSNTIIESNLNLSETSDEVEETISLEKKIMAFDSFVESFYDCLSTPELNFKMLKDGLKGYYSMKADEKLTNSRYLSLIDFTLPSNKDRLFVIDMESKKVIIKSIIAHGRNSGGLNATKFSNESESKMSSLGFFTTGNIYDGKYEYSMKLHGLEYSNDNVFERGVVMHSADYATKEFLKKNGNVLGRSFGCPALPHKGYKKIVDTIKGGSCMFIFGKDRRYFRKSHLLKTHNFIEAFYSDFE